MKGSKIILTSVLITGIITSSAYASPVATPTPGANKQAKKMCSEVMHKKGGMGKGGLFGDFGGLGRRHGNPMDKDMKKDPLKMLEERKTNIQTKLKEGKIKQEDATLKISKIDEEIKKITEFNALTLDQKKEKLNSEFKLMIQEKVTAGKIEQTKADEMIKKHAEQIAKWDGTGHPMLGKMAGGMKKKGNHHGFFGKDLFKKSTDEKTKNS